MNFIFQTNLLAQALRHCYYAITQGKKNPGLITTARFAPNLGRAIAPGLCAHYISEPTVMQEQSFKDLQRALSPKRLEAYRPSGASDKITVANYFWNAAVCEALFPMLQQLEVAFRNTLHQSIGAAFSDTEWLTHGISFLDVREKEKIQDAKMSLIRQHIPATEDDLIGELSFGFWTSLSDSRYDRQWPKFIKAAFPYCITALRTRDEISSRANKLRKLRNAVFHHHSIWRWRDLEDHHKSGLALIDWISPELAKLTRANDRFPKVFASRPRYK